MPLESLGDLILQVGADLSPLEDTLQSVPAVAQQAGAAIDSALSGALDGATVSLAQLSNAVSDVGPSATSAAGQMGLFAQSTANANEQLLIFVQGTLEDAKTGFSGIEQNATAAAAATKDVRQSVSDLAEPTNALSNAMQLAGAIVGAEALREFATAAIEAFSAAQRTQVSLTALSGSFQAASSIIQQMRDLSMSEALSYPQLIAARTRMEALGISSQNASAGIQLAANSAAAMGISFEAASNRMDAMITSGVVMTRSLASMGVSADRLAAAMHVSISQMAKEFKTLSEDARIEVLQEAMSNLAGVAQQQAATISGAFTRLHNDILFAMMEIGKAIAPTVLEWVEVFEGLIKGLGAVATGFETAAVAIGASMGASRQEVDSTGRSATGFIVTVGGLITVFGLAEVAVRALNLSWETLNTTMKAAGPIALAAAGAELVLSIHHWLDALNDLDASEQTLQKRLEGATKYLRDHGIQIDADRQSLTLWSQQVQAGFAELAKGGSTIEAHNASLDRWEKTQTKLNQAVTDAKAHLAEVKAALDAGAPVQAEYAKAVDEVTKAEKAADPLGYANAHKALADAISHHKATLEQLTEAYATNNISAETATKTLARAQTAYDAAQASGQGLAQAQGVLVAAQNQLVAALEKSDPLMKSHAATVAEIGVKYEQAQLRVNAAASALEQAQTAYQQAQVTGFHLAETQAVLITAQNDYKKAVEEANPLLKLHVQSLQEMSVAYDQNQMKVQAAKVVLDQAKASLDQLTSAADNGIVVLRGYSNAHSQSTIQVVAAKGALDAATSSLGAMTAAHGNAAKALALVQQAQENYTAALKAADAMAKGHGASLDSLKAKYDENKLAVEAATNTLNQAIAANDGSAKMAEVVAMAQVNLAAAVKTLDEHTKAATASVHGHTAALSTLSTQAQETVGHFGDYSVVLGNATGATRVHVQSIQELTNHENALQAALAQARITLDAAKLGYDGSGASLAILNAAEAQFNKLLGEADPLLKQQISDMNGLAGAAKGAASAIGSAGSALDGFQSTVSRSSANVNMQELSAMFGGYQGMSAFDAVTGGGAIGSHAGQNVVMQDGEIISQTDVNPGTLSPVPHGHAPAIVAAVVTAVQGSLSMVADAAAVLQQIAQNDFAGAIAQLQKDGESMQNAFNDVMNAADAMRQGGASLQDAGAQISAGVNQTLGTFSGVAQAALNTITSTQSAVVAATVGVMAAAMAVLPVAAAVAAPKMSVGSLNQYGVNTGLPTGAAGPYVGSGPQGVTFNFNGTTVGGAAGVRELGNMLMNQMRQAGMRF